MSVRKFFRSVLALAALAAGVTQADEVHVAGGSVLQGRVTGLADGKLTLVTDYAGTLTLEQAKVTAIRTDDPRYVRLASGSTLLGTLQGQGGQTQVQTVNGALNISGDTITAIWQADAEAPEVVALKAEAQKVQAASAKWTVNAGLDIGGTMGNKDSSNYGGAIRAERKTPKDRLVLGASAKQAEVEGSTTVEKADAIIEYEHNITDLDNWYARTAVSRDGVKDLDLQTDIAVGYGHYFWKDADPNHHLLGRVGLLLRNEDYGSLEDKQSLGLDLALLHEWQIRRWLKIRNSLGFTPSFEDFGDYQIKHETAVDLMLANSQNWAIRAGLKNEYRSQPAGMNEELDSTYFLQLVWNWKQGEHAKK